MGRPAMRDASSSHCLALSRVGYPLLRVSLAFSLASRAENVKLFADAVEAKEQQTQKS